MLKNSFLTQSSRQSDGEIVHRTVDGKRDYPQSRLVVSLSGSPDQPGLRGMIWQTDTSATGCPNLLKPPITMEESDQPEWLRLALKKEQERDRPRRKAMGVPVALQKKITIRKMLAAENGQEPKFANLAAILVLISEQTGVSVIADDDPGYESYYSREWARYLPLDLIDVRAVDALDEVARIWRVEWRTQKNWVQVISIQARLGAVDGIDISPPGQRTKN